MYAVNMLWASKDEIVVQYSADSSMPYMVN